MKKTKVLFLIEKDSENEVFAYFPNEINFTIPLPNGTKETAYDCYSHIGQHSSCNLMYVQSCNNATPEQYKDLKQELESIGYNLQILNQQQ